MDGRLAGGEPVELDWGLVVAPPKDPSAPGTSGCYRWTFYDSPVREDGSRGERRYRVARVLDDRTWLRIEEDLEELEASVAGRPSTRLDSTFGELAEHWLEPARHPDWWGRGATPCRPDPPPVDEPGRPGRPDLRA